MNRKQFLLALVFVAVFSFLGGIVGGAISGGGIIMAAKDLLEGDSVLYPKKINYLESKKIEVDTIRTKKFDLVNDNKKVVGGFTADNYGDPIFFLFSKENPSTVDNRKSVFSIQAVNSEPVMLFRDKDLDARILFGIDKLEPSIDFLYRGKNRLTLGTNVIAATNTGNVTTLKGSICTFDNKGKLTSQMP